MRYEYSFQHFTLEKTKTWIRKSSLEGVVKNKQSQVLSSIAFYMGLMNDFKHPLKRSLISLAQNLYPSVFPHFNLAMDTTKTGMKFSKGTSVVPLSIVRNANCLLQYMNERFLHSGKLFFIV